MFNVNVKTYFRLCSSAGLEMDCNGLLVMNCGGSAHY